MIWHHPEACRARQGLNYSWIGGPRIVLRIGQLQCYWRLRLRPLKVFGDLCWIWPEMVRGLR